MNNGIHYLTFATSNWTNVLSRQSVVLNNIQKKFSFFKSVSILSENNLSSTWHSKYSKFAHINGYALWAWKPYIVYEKLLQINDNDFLFYADGGCTFPENHNLQNFLLMLNLIAAKTAQQPLQIAVEPAGIVPVYKIIRKQILKQFNLQNDIEFLKNSPHYEAGVLMIQKTPATLAFIKKWMQFFEDHFEDSIVSEYYDKSGQVPDFIQNGSDQAVLQCLLWQAKGQFYSIQNTVYYQFGFYSRQRN